jgi:hypothetical protein
MAVLALLVILWDEKIHWYEGLGMLFVYALYILAMYHDAWLRSCFNRLKESKYLRKLNHQNPTGEGKTFSKQYRSRSKDMSSSQVAIVTICGSTFSIEEHRGNKVIRYIIHKLHGGCGCSAPQDDWWYSIVKVAI